MKKIQLTQGKYALVDDEDFEWLNSWKWFYRNASNGYACRHSTKKDSPRLGLISMHREILTLQNNQFCDHKNGNGLDNQRKNLRVCTLSENQWNTPKRKTNTSKYKGISYNKRDKVWTAMLRSQGKNLWLGGFKNKNDAIKIYKDTAHKLRGAFVRF